MKKNIWLLFCFFLLVNISIGDYNIVKAEEIQYYIQVGALTKKESLESLKNKLQKNGYEPYTNYSGGITRVFVGKYSTKAEAEKDIQKLKGIGIKGFIKSQKAVDGLQKKETSNDTNKKTNSEGSNNTQHSSETEKNNNTNVISKNYEFASDVTINSEYGTHVFFFESSENWNVRNTCYFNLVLSQSQLNYNHNSTLTVYINDLPIYTIPLDNKDKYKENIKIPIPVDSIHNGLNSVKIKIFSNIEDKTKIDNLNITNWLVFNKESHIHLDFIDKEDTLKINEYPYPYLKVSNDTPSNSMFILPDNGASHLMEAAVILATDFGERSSFDNVNINIFKYSDAVDKDKTNIIFIGAKSDLPKEILQNLSEAEKYIIENDALIKEIVSPYNENYKMLMILSNNKENLIKAAKTLCYDNIVNKMDSDTQFISSKFPMHIPINQELENYNLEKLGYSDVLLEGLFRQEAVYRMQVPKSKVIKEGAKVVIKMRYSKILNFEKSLMTIYINNKPIGSKKLSESTANNDSFEIEIPKELLDAECYDLKIAFDLEIKDINKNSNLQSSVWAFISKESFLYLPTENKKDTYYEDFTSHFIEKNSFNDVLIVMPDNPSKAALSVMANISAFFGHDIETIENIDVIKSNEFWDKHKDKNIIAIGEGKSNTFIQNLNEYFHVQFNSSFNEFEINKQMNILEDKNSNLGVLQLIQSPYNENKKIMVITSTKEEGLLRCEKYLTDFSFVSQVRGNTVIIDESGNINYRYFGDEVNQKIYGEKTEDEKPQKEGMINSSQLRNISIVIVLILSFVIASSIIILKKDRSKDNSKDKSINRNKYRRKYRSRHRR